MNKDPKEYICEMMGLSVEQFNKMSDDQKISVSRDLLDSFSEAVQELHDFIVEEIVAPLVESMHTLGETLVECAATIEQNVDAADLQRATPSDRQHITAFVSAARKYDKSRGLNKMR